MGSDNKSLIIKLLEIITAVSCITLAIYSCNYLDTSNLFKFIIAGTCLFISGWLTKSLLISPEKNTYCNKIICTSEIINDISYNIGDITDTDVIFNRLTAAVNKYFTGYNGLISKTNTDQNHATIFSVWDKELKPLIINDVAESDRSTEVNEICLDAQNRDETSCFSQSIFTQNTNFGEIRIWNNEHNSSSFSSDDNQFLTMICNIAALALSNIRARKSIMTKSVRDPLTGLFNKGYLEDTIERELHRAHRCNYPLGILMIDIDKFDELIELYTSEAGNKVLSSVSGLLQGTFRGHDISCRYSNNVFVQVLPEASLENTLKRAEELCIWISELNIKYMGDPLPAITASIGICNYPNHADTNEELMEAAVSATFRAKNAGMDQVVVAERVFHSSD